MDYTLSVYEKAMPDSFSLKEKLEAAEKNGFDAVEISIDESDARLARLKTDKSERKMLRKYCGEYIHFNSMCLSGHRRFPMGSSNREIEARAMEIMYDAVEFAYDLGINIIQLAGYDVFYDETTNPDTEKRFTENLVKASEFAGRRGILLGIETMENDFCNTVKKGMRFVEKVNSPYLNMYPDIGNVTNGTDDVSGDLESGRGRIIAVHLKETKENVFRNMKYGEGRVDFKACAEKCRDLGVTMFNAEFWHQKKEGYEEELRFSNGYLRNILDGVYR